MEPVVIQTADFGCQVDIKPQISEARLNALKKGREDYHRMNREYKAILLQQAQQKGKEIEPVPPPVVQAPPKLRSISFV